MKRTLLLGLLIVSTLGTVFSQVEKEIISEKGIENIELNMPLDKALELLTPNYRVEKKITKVWENDNDSIVFMRVFESDSDKLIFSFIVDYNENPNGIVWTFQIYSDKYKTMENLSIGDTYKKIKETYELDQAYFNYNDGLFIFLKNRNIRFRLNTEYDPNDEFKSEYSTLDDIPEFFPIDMIVLF